MQKDSRNVSLGSLALLALTIVNISAETRNEVKLLSLAHQHFGDTNVISIAEEKLFRAAANGTVADCGVRDPSIYNPTNSASWPKDYIVRADRLEWLCTDEDATKLVAYRGITITGALISGKLDLEAANITFPLRVRYSTFERDIVLAYCRLRLLDLQGCYVQRLQAENLETHNSLFLRGGFHANGDVQLTGAKIGGDLDCTGAQFSVPDRRGNVIVAERAQIHGSVLLRRDFKAQGCAYFKSATIRGLVSCIDGQFLATNGTALTLESAIIKGGVLLRGSFNALGEVTLDYATIGGSLECVGGQFSNTVASALSAQATTVTGGVLLRDGFHATGLVDFLFAKIGSDFDCENAEFSNSNSVALTLESATITGSLLLKYCKALGDVNLDHTSIGRNLECDNAHFANGASYALSVQSATILEDVFLRENFMAQGPVDFSYASIGGELDCGRGLFTNSSKIALNIKEAKIGKDVLLTRDFRAQGEVEFEDATIGGSVDWREGHFINSGSNALTAMGMKVEGRLIFRTDFDAVGRLNLTSARVGTLELGLATLPQSNDLLLEGFTYDRMTNLNRENARKFLKWIRLQANTTFSVQPYEQLATLLKKYGYEQEAKEVMIAKNDELAARMQGVIPRAWWWTKGKIVGYGYKPFWAAAWSLIPILFGYVVFRIAYFYGIICPLDPTKAFNTDEYPPFNAFIFSLETFVPLLSLAIGEDWGPNADRNPKFCRPLVRGYLYTHIILGWVMTSFWVGAFTGLVKT